MESAEIIADTVLVRVAAIAPFWRYAVGPMSAHSPAIPCYTLKSAEALFVELQNDLPCSGAILYRRKGWSGIETLCEYRPLVGVESAAPERIT